MDYVGYPLKNGSVLKIPPESAFHCNKIASGNSGCSSRRTRYQNPSGSDKGGLSKKDHLFFL